MEDKKLENGSEKGLDENNKIEAVEEKSGSVIENKTTGANEEYKEEKRLDNIEGSYNESKAQTSNSAFKPFNTTYNDSKSIDDEIEDLRDKYYNILNKTKIIDRVSLIVMLAALIGVLIVSFTVGKNHAWVTWMVLGIAAVLIIGFFIFSTIFNKKNSKVAQKYYEDFEELTNSFLFYNLEAVDLAISPDATFDNQKIIEAHYFNTINEIQSRAVVDGKRNGHTFSFGEVCVLIPQVAIDEINKVPTELVTLDDKPYVQVEDNTSTTEIRTNDVTMVDLDLSDSTLNDQGKMAKKRESDLKKAEKKREKDAETTYGFFGKFLSYDLKVKSDESFIISFIGDKANTCLPTYTDGFKATHVDNLRKDIIVYAICPLKVKKFFSEDNVKLLDSINISSSIQSLFISVNSYGSKVGYRLSDSIMEIPLKTYKKNGAFDQLNDAMNKTFTFLDNIEKNKDNE